MRRKIGNTISVLGERNECAQPHVLNAHDEGFTLLEMVVVVMILGLISAIVMPNIMKTLFQQRIAVTKQQLTAYDAAFQRFAMDAGRYPTNTEGVEALYARPEGLDKWDGPYLRDRGKDQDPWGHDWIYRSPSVRPGQRDYDLCSAGPNGSAENPGEQGAICNP